MNCGFPGRGSSLRGLFRPQELPPPGTCIWHLPLPVPDVHWTPHRAIQGQLPLLQGAGLDHLIS